MKHPYSSTGDKGVDVEPRFSVDLGAVGISQEDCHRRNIGPSSALDNLKNWPRLGADLVVSGG